MSEVLLKNYAIAIQDKLLEKMTPSGKVIIYETPLFGKMLTINDELYLAERDSHYFHEMMVHPAMFAHTRAKQVAILGVYTGILEEILKHSLIDKIDCVYHDPELTLLINHYFGSHNKPSEKVQLINKDNLDWLTKSTSDQYDILFINRLDSPDVALNAARVLKSDGILVHPITTPLWQLESLQPFHDFTQKAGFRHFQILQFTQPSYSMGQRALLLATKLPALKQIKERDIFNKTFETRFYNYDIHKAAMALPEFLKK